MSIKWAARSTALVSTRMVAENAVSGMMNVLRATFRQPSIPVEATASGPQTTTVSSQQSNPVNSRASSASRGRGLVKRVKD